VLAGVGEDGLLLLGERLGERDRPGRLDRASLRPGLLLEPTVVAAAGDPQRRQCPLHRPTTASPGLLDVLVDSLLQLGWELSVIF
jgi:hypothetical protein